MKKRALFFVYGNSFLFNFANGMIQIMIPLYALNLGFSVLQIGIIVSAQAVLNIILRLFGGLLSDMIGERPILWFSFTSISIGAILFAFSSPSIWILISIQMIIGASRSLYWSPSQSYASRIEPKKAGKILGRNSSFVYAGMLLGFLSGGVVSDLFGFTIAFLIAAGAAFIALIGAIVMPDLPRPKKEPENLRQFLAPIPHLFGKKALYLAAITAFVAALTVSMVSSIYPIYFREIGYGGTEIGYFSALRPVGNILVGVVFAYLLARLGQKVLFAIAMGGTGLLIASTPFVESLWSITLLFLAIGTTAGCADVLYQIMVSENSREDRRGLAFSFVGMAWGFSHLIVPLFFGFIGNQFGLAKAFWICGGILITISLMTMPLFRWLRPEEKINSPKIKNSVTI